MSQSWFFQVYFLRPARSHQVYVDSGLFFYFWEVFLAYTCEYYFCSFILFLVFRDFNYKYVGSFCLTSFQPLDFRPFLLSLHPPFSITCLFSLCFSLSLIKCLFKCYPCGSCNLDCISHMILSFPFIFMTLKNLFFLFFIHQKIHFCSWFLSFLSKVFSPILPSSCL